MTSVEPPVGSAEPPAGLTEGVFSQLLDRSCSLFVYNCVPFLAKVGGFFANARAGSTTFRQDPSREGHFPARIGIDAQSELWGPAMPIKRCITQTQQTHVAPRPASHPKDNFIFVPPEVSLPLELPESWTGGRGE